MGRTAATLAISWTIVGTCTAWPNGLTVITNMDFGLIANGPGPVLGASTARAYSCAPDARELTLTTTAHPSHQRLVDLAEGRLGALERSRVERHVSECAACSGVLGALARPASLTPPPQATADRGMFGRARRFLLNSSGAAEPPKRVQLVGALRFDSATMPPAYGMRGIPENGDRQLLYEAGPFEIELHMRQRRAGWDLSGQVLGPTSATSGEMRVIGARASARSRLSELLEFQLPTLPHGTYQMELRLAGDALLHIGPVELEP